LDNKAMNRNMFNNFVILQSFHLAFYIILTKFPFLFKLSTIFIYGRQ